jgi:hypothetical protein
MAEATCSDKFAQVRGFSVEFTGAGAGGKEVDTGWETVSGGELIIETTDTTIGGDKFQTTSPGHKSVGEITLRGAMTGKRAALCTWINETVNGKPWKRTLTITELLSVDGGVKDGKQYIYFDCFPVGYVFPHISPPDPCARVEEELRFVYRRLVVVDPPPNA